MRFAWHCLPARRSKEAPCCRKEETQPAARRNTFLSRSCVNPSCIWIRCAVRRCETWQRPMVQRATSEFKLERNLCSENRNTFGLDPQSVFVIWFSVTHMKMNCFFLFSWPVVSSVRVVGQCVACRRSLTWSSRYAHDERERERVGKGRENVTSHNDTYKLSTK